MERQGRRRSRHFSGPGVFFVLLFWFIGFFVVVVVLAFACLLTYFVCFCEGA